MSSWVEVVLSEWGVWLRTKGAGQGWGGSVDLDRLFDLCQFRAPGVHSDPVLAEVTATMHDGQGRMQRVHQHILQLSAPLQTVARLRYAGILEPVSDPGPRDHRRWIVSRGTLEGCGGAEVEIAGEVWFSESHSLPFGRIAELMACDSSRVHGLLGALHRMVRAELLQDARTRKTTNADSEARRHRA